MKTQLTRLPAATRFFAATGAVPAQDNASRLLAALTGFMRRLKRASDRIEVGRRRIGHLICEGFRRFENFRPSAAGLGRAAVGAACLLLAGSALASTVLVTSMNDSGPGSLRAAIASANPGDTVTFALPIFAGITTITLTSGELDIAKSLTITGPSPRYILGQTALTISGNNSSRVFNITSSSATVTISGLIITGGLSQGAAGNGGNGVPGQGGGIFNSGTLTLTGCYITNNNATGGVANDNSGNGGNGEGGGIYNSGTLTLTGCTLAVNNANGGNAEDSSGNGGDGEGGGIFSSGTLTLVNCTLWGNLAGGADEKPYGNGYGGGIYCEGAVAVTSCTISVNTVRGPGFTTSGQGTGSAYGGGIFVLDGSPRIKNTIVSGNMWLTDSTLKGVDVDGAVTSGGFNLIGDADDSSGWIASGVGKDLTGTFAARLDPQLGPLQYNGGPTPTMALLATSPEVDRGFSFGLTTDQRGDPRPVIWNMITEPPGGDGSDIGAFELQHPSLGGGVGGGGSFTLRWPSLYPLLWWPLQTPPPLVNPPPLGLQTLSVSNLASGEWTAFSGAVRYYNVENEFVARDQIVAGPGVLYRLIDPATNIFYVPPAFTMPATSITSSNATLNGTTTPYGFDTLYWFQYGATTNYGMNTVTNSLTTSTNLAGLSCPIGGLSPVTVYHFRLLVTDDDGMQTGGDKYFSTGCVTPPSGLVNWWPGDDNAADIVGGNYGALKGGVTFATGEVGQAFNFDGTSGFVSTSLLITNPQTFSLTLWFRTASTNGGVLISFDSTQTNLTGSLYDRNIYLDDTGALHFGVWNSGAQQINSTSGYNDNNWHQVVGNLSASTGLSLYVDGVLAGNNPAVTYAQQNYNGYWRFGEDDLNNWPYQPSSYYFQGQIDEVAIFNTALSSTNVAAIYAAGSAGMCQSPP